MERSVIKAVITICAKSIALTMIVGVAIWIIGCINQWNSSITYSNAFFVTGCLLIIAGTSSRYAAGQNWNDYQLLNAESFHEMSSRERITFIINENSPISLVILGVLTGLLLILISAIAAYLL